MANPFDYSGVGAAMPESYGANVPISDPLAKALLSTMTLPQRAIEGAAAYQPGSGEIPDQTIGPSLETAMMMLGGGGVAGSGVSKAGETALGIVPVDVAKKLNFKTGAPSDVLKSAVQNTPSAAIDEDGHLLLDVIRNQRPEQSGAESVRGGVFYLPKGSKDSKYYTGTKQNFAYGGTEPIEGQTAFKNPLVVKGATGGKAPEAAYDILNGKGSYEKMRTDALRSTGPSYLNSSDKGELVRQFLEKHAPEIEHLSDYIVSNSTKGNQLPYALQEAAVASAVRKAGHDGVVGYSMKRNPTKDPFISEVYDARESHYPTPEGDYELHQPLIDAIRGGGNG